MAPTSTAKSPQKQLPPPPPPAVNFVFGMLAACTSTALVHPLDVARVRAQVDGSGKSWMASLVRSAQTRGIASIYDGLSANLLRQVFYGATRFSVFASTQDALKKHRQVSVLSPTDKLIAGIVAGVTAGVVGNPADVALTRMSADRNLPAAMRRHYRNGVDALIRIGREEGLFTRGLMRGVVAHVQRALIVNVTMLPSYEQTKQILAHDLGIRNVLVTQVIAGNVAGFVTACCVLPVDVIKTRMQNTSGTEAQGVIKVAGEIFKQAGPRGFYVGFVPMWFKLAPHTTLSFIIMEWLREAWTLQQ